MNPIKVVDGINLHATMMAEADKAIAGKGDGRISIEDAKALIASHKKNSDENSLRTLEYLSDNHNCTPAAKELLKNFVGTHFVLPIASIYPENGARNKIGLAVYNRIISIVYRAVDNNDYYNANWNPIVDPTGTTSPKVIGNGNPGCPSAMVILSHFDNSTYSVLQAHGGSLLYFSILNAAGTPLGSGGITIIDPTAKVKRVAASTLRAVALTTLGQNVFLSWIDEKTNTVNLAVMDSSLEKYGEFNLLFSTVNADGYEKTNYGAGIIPVAINEQVGKNIELRQKIMIVWSSSEHTNQLCSIFYDLASYTFTNFQTCPTYTGVTSAIAIEKISDGTEDIMVATGSRDKPDNKFNTAKYSVGQGQAIGGNWNLPTVIHPIDDESVQYAPTLTQYLGDLYLFYVTSKLNYIRYMEIVENHNK